MLQLQNISLTQFRNYIYQQHNFTNNIVGICGANGAGKTNLLDAIYYLSFCKSYFNRTDNSNITHNYQGFRLEGNFNNNGDFQKITCINRNTSKKEFLLNDVQYEKLSKHI